MIIIVSPFHYPPLTHTHSTSGVQRAYDALCYKDGAWLCAGWPTTALPASGLEIQGALGGDGPRHFVVAMLLGKVDKTASGSSLLSDRTVVGLPADIMSLLGTATESDTVLPSLYAAPVEVAVPRGHLVAAPVTSRAALDASAAMARALSAALPRLLGLLLAFPAAELARVAPHWHAGCASGVAAAAGESGDEQPAVPLVDQPTHRADGKAAGVALDASDAKADDDASPQGVDNDNGADKDKGVDKLETDALGAVDPVKASDALEAAADTEAPGHHGAADTPDPKSASSDKPGKASSTSTSNGEWVATIDYYYIIIDILL